MLQQNDVSRWCLGPRGYVGGSNIPDRSLGNLTFTSRSSGPPFSSMVASGTRAPGAVGGHQEPEERFGKQRSRRTDYATLGPVGGFAGLGFTVCVFGSTKRIRPRGWQ